jgi:hypothetical protein
MFVQTAESITCEELTLRSHPRRSTSPTGLSALSADDDFVDLWSRGEQLRTIAECGARSRAGDAVPEDIVS